MADSSVRDQKPDDFHFAPHGLVNGWKWVIPLPDAPFKRKLLYSYFLQTMQH